jgi:hypothetical protein
MPDAPFSPTRITATIDAVTGKIIDIRSVDDGGAARALTAERRARLSQQSGGATIEDMIEQAFEAGIACVLGDDANDDAAEPETEADAALRRQILRPMIENSTVRSAMRQDALGRAIVATLMKNASPASP